MFTKVDQTFLFFMIFHDDHVGEIIFSTLSCITIKNKNKQNSGLFHTMEYYTSKKSEITRRKS